MNGSFIIKRYNSENSAVQFFNFAPKPKPVMFLALDFDGILYNFDAPFFL
jgi:hypothetical protein